MYARTDLDELDAREVDGIEPDLKAVGYQLRPAEMRPSVWEFEPGEATNWHRQRDQEELYYVLDGSFRATVASEAGPDGADGERERFELGTDEVAVVPPETWRQLEALEPGRLLVVGAPNAKDDGITADEAEPIAEDEEESEDDAVADGEKE